MTKDKESNLSCLDPILVFIGTIALYIGGWYFLGTVESGKEGVWYDGIFHGMYYYFNESQNVYAEYAGEDVQLTKAETYTTMYNVWFWVFRILTFPFFIWEYIKSIIWVNFGFVILTILVITILCAIIISFIKKRKKK